MRTSDDFLTQIASEMEQEGYPSDLRPRLPEIQALLYSHSSQRLRSGAAKVENHFLFMDWDNAASGSLDLLRETYRRFSSYVNQGFRTPHVLRMRIPNLAIVALSQAEFPEQVTRYARTTSLNPWYGGEVGQVILVETEKKHVITLEEFRIGRSPRSGAFALEYAANLIRTVCKRVL